MPPASHGRSKTRAKPARHNSPIPHIHKHRGNHPPVQSPLQRGEGPALIIRRPADRTRRTEGQDQDERRGQRDQGVKVVGPGTKDAQDSKFRTGRIHPQMIVSGKGGISAINALRGTHLSPLW